MRDSTGSALTRTVRIENITVAWEYRSPGKYRSATHEYRSPGLNRSPGNIGRQGIYRPLAREREVISEPTAKGSWRENETSPNAFERSRRLTFVEWLALTRAVYEGLEMGTGRYRRRRGWSGKVVPAGTVVVVISPGNQPAGRASRTGLLRDRNDGSKSMQVCSGSKD